jgi:hypothetical protein
MLAADKFCSCIKQVQTTLKSGGESRAIAICVKSMLHRRGRTLKKFKCLGGKPMLQTQAFSLKN